MATVRSQLIAAAKSRQLVRLSRRFERTPVRGYVLDVGPQFFLLLLVSDRIWFDGFECFRVADMRSVKADAHAAFVKAALRKRKARRPRKPPVSVRSVPGMVQSAGRAFPLVAVHREEIDASVCWIGRVLKVRGGRVLLLEVDPAAKWRDRPTEFRLAELTRLNFGGDYEGALHLVAGEPEAG
jgi:hypothetical protein